jgi:hypothetical protein
MRAFVLIMALLAMPASAAEVGRFDLVCRGKVGRNESAGAFRLPGEADKRVTYDDVLYLRLLPDGSGQAQAPKKMQPAYKDDEAGWFKIIEASITPDQIGGKIRFNSMYKPKLHVDRRTGLVTVFGKLGDFSGDCAPYDPSSSARKF